VKGPELLNMYVGQSEENVREGMSTCQNYLLVIFTCLPSNSVYQGHRKILKSGTA